ncbi:hypothetical protein [Flavobacterium gilvum]|uniref:Dihydrolipoamide dehydrogenase n=1 Tax=Flavobacterium gilvum TaxID=1492737 RepID=A0AAC9I6N2_9FLAO|nr:hypothetical protein [Flavobacterium gilvum]AOW09623.1 hypothetical protein EM308_08965 [Flavobacterium gilvum]KFC58536.1 hypothetical protein FEM08_26670 [Flavobacterium gilvum]
MKKIITILAVIAMFGFQACEGPEGPPGPAGQDGLLAEVYEVTKVNFDATNNYNPIIPLVPAILPSDMVLVYRLSGSTNGNDIWTALPDTYFLSDGTRDFGFNFDFSINDVALYLEAKNLAGVSTNFRLNQIFRIVIIPGYVTGNTSKKVSKSNFSDYNAVVEKYNITESQVKKIDIQ